MDRRLLTLLVLVAAAAVVAVLTVGLSAVKPQPESAPAATPAPGPSQVSEAGGVQVRATFDPLTNIAGERITFAITLDTHSVDLGQFDLGRQSRVILEPGGLLTDVSWQSEGGGHHLGGTLSARAPVGALAGAALVRLEVAGVASEEPRRFAWRLGSP